MTLSIGSPVADRFGAPIGRVERVCTLSGPTFDGLVVSTPWGSRFIDAPEVRHIDENLVTLTLACADCRTPSPTKINGALPAQLGRTSATDEDRQSVVELLKAAYVHDHITAHELADRFEAVYATRTLDELEALLVTARPSWEP